MNQFPGFFFVNILDLYEEKNIFKKIMKSDSFDFKKYFLTWTFTNFLTFCFLMLFFVGYMRMQKYIGHSRQKSKKGAI